CDVIYKQKPDIPNSRWGDRLYVVMAQKRTSQRNQEIWAGIGWIQDKKTGEGLLVEHEGHSETEVRADIDHSLMALAKNRNLNLGPHNVHVIGTKCENLPVCAVAIAVFQSTGWRNSGSLDKFKVLKRS
ncbi:MAG TPA: pyruvoyl-dependent arginine decarboxylase, partial [Patescibacteria group bacterium]|nr:pyruvoyl-dependent arginine decarboxylase [Patescibacteria group bacterium]